VAVAKYQHLRPDKPRTKTGKRVNPFGIALCNDKLCPSKGLCYRFTSRTLKGELYLTFPRGDGPDCPFAVFIKRRGGD
jgi:hypothetical protein